MKKLAAFLKKEAMPAVSAAAALLSFLLAPPSKALFGNIDWKTLATLFMLLSVLDGFREGDLFRPFIRLAGRFRTQLSLSFFLVFSVFFSSMFVTNDVSLIIFVPLTMLLFRRAGKERYTVPVLVLENIAAVRGSLLTPFGSPQNLFLFGKSGLSAPAFVRMMLPLWLLSIAVLSLFILLPYRKDLTAPAGLGAETLSHGPDTFGNGKRALYLALFALVLLTIVSRTAFWPQVTLLVAVVLFIFDRGVFRRVDYGLLFTFFCFFIFSSSVSGSPAVSGFLKRSVAGNEYPWALALSQLISNVPAAIVLWPFTEDLRALIYGLDTAGLLTIIGSLASVIDLRLYSREYPGQALRFLVTFEKLSLAFFAVIFLPQLLLLRI